MVTKEKNMKPDRTHAADTVFSNDEKGFGIGFSICGIYSTVLVKNRKLVTCKNCLKRLAKS